MFHSCTAVLLLTDCLLPFFSSLEGHYHHSSRYSIFYRVNDPCEHECCFGRLDTAAATAAVATAGNHTMTLNGTTCRSLYDRCRHVVDDTHPYYYYYYHDKANSGSEVSGNRPADHSTASRRTTTGGGGGLSVPATNQEDKSAKTSEALGSARLLYISTTTPPLAFLTFFLLCLLHLLDN